MYIPWKIRKLWSDTRSLACFWRNRLQGTAPARAPGQAPSVEFNIPFYGFTGGSAAIVAVANMLAQDHDVSLVTHPTNILNCYAGRGVRLVTRPSLDRDVYVMEGGSDRTLMGALIERNAKVIISNHWFYSGGDASRKNHGFADEDVAAALELATSAHFLSQEQVDAYRPAGVRLKHVRIIPNAVPGVAKTRRTRNAGIVGDTTLPVKNVARAVAAAEASAAAEVHVWGRFSDTYGSSRAHWQGFATDKRRIFDSFDVLVSLSLNETQPLIVLEALSAGVPCVLSRLPCYDSFRGVPGFWFVEPEDTAAASAAIDAALAAGDDVREGLRALWQRSFSPAAIHPQWNRYLAELAAA